MTVVTGFDGSLSRRSADALADVETRDRVSWLTQ
jgi:hypothetical protein